MTRSLRLLPCVALLALTATAVQAQTANRGGTRDSFIPRTTEGYFGLSLGKSSYDINGGSAPGLTFDDSDTAGKIYTGGYFNRNLGLEFGYLNMGKAERIGGSTKAHGFNLSLVGRAPLNEQFDVFGKVGTTYGRTETSGTSGLGVQTGKDDGFGLSYGAGVRWSFSPQWAAVMEWERHRFHFADGKSDVDMATIGVQYRY